MADTKKKQHFVPQCYLQGFTDTNSHLHVLDKFAGRSYKAHMKDVAQKHRFYDFLPDNDGDMPMRNDEDVLFSLQFKGDMPHPQIVEETLSKLEKDYAAAFRDIQETITQRKPLTRHQKFIFSHFIAVQWRRTPEHRRTLIEMYEKVSEKLWAMTHEGQPKRFIFHPKAASIAQAEDMFSPFVNEKIIQVLMSHIWVVGINTSDTLLYTSDQPVVKMSRGDMQGFGSSGIQVTLPLTPRNALLLCDRRVFPQLISMGYENKYMELDGEDVKHYNSLQLRDSYQYTYSQDGDFLFAVEYLTEHPDVCKPREHRIEVS